MKTFDATTPIYLQIMDDIKQRICAGHLLPGEKLSSVRDFALTQGVNPNTVQKAFSQLEHEQLLFANRTNGRFVTEDEELIKKMKKELAAVYVLDFLKKMGELGYKKGEIMALMTECEKEELINECN